MTKTLCVECDHVVEHTRKLSQFKWLCIKFPRVAGGSFLDPNWLTDAPYNRCVNINVGHCPMFEARKIQEDNDG